MKKLYLITMSGTKNYGSALQTFATQEIFKRYDVDTTVINYIKEGALDKNLLKTWCGNNVIKKIIMYPTVKKWKKVFGDFYQEHINFTNKIYTYDNDFNNFPNDGDYYCTGSDQVWNSTWNKGIIKPLYLSFAPDNKIKFSYSASFGKETIDEEEIEATLPLLGKYKYLSVREEKGLYILKNQYNFDNCVQVLDPTLMLTANEWKKLGNNRFIKEKYILVYNLNRSKEFDNYCKMISKKTGLKLIRFCTRYDQIFRCGKSVVIPKVNDFISLIANAELVITDSFHATAFSINLNTKPLCIYPQKFGNRIESFLKIVDLEKLHVKDYNDYGPLDVEVDFSVVNEKLDIERNKSILFLNKVFYSEV